MSESVFNHDFGLITKEEFDNFKLNTRNDLELKADFGVKFDIDDDYEQEYIGGYFGYISTVTKLSQRLGVTKLEEYTALLGTKYFQPESFVLPDHQILLDQYERKLLSSTKINGRILSISNRSNGTNIQWQGNGSKSREPIKLVVVSCPA